MVLFNHIQKFNSIILFNFITKVGIHLVVKLHAQQCNDDMQDRVTSVEVNHSSKCAAARHWPLI